MKRLKFELDEGRKLKTTSRDDMEILRMIKKNRFESAKNIVNHLKSLTGNTISLTSIRDRIHKAGFSGCIARKKPFLTKNHMKRRMNFAKNYYLMPASFWKKVLWSDESKFNLKKSDGAQRVWRKRGEAFNLSCTRGTIKHGGGSVMLWGCMAWNGVGKLEFTDETMNADLYNNILKRNLKSSAKSLRLGNSFLFQQDNDPKHTAKKTKTFFDENGINVLEWPSQSPDLNPIEHLRTLLDKKIGNRAFTKKEDLKKAVVKSWSNIDNNQIKCLVESMPKRLLNVIKAKGGLTKY